MTDSHPPPPVVESNDLLLWTRNVRRGVTQSLARLDLLFSIARLTEAEHDRLWRLNFRVDDLSVGVNIRLVHPMVVMWVGFGEAPISQEASRDLLTMPHHTPTARAAVSADGYVTVMAEVLGEFFVPVDDPVAGRLRNMMADGLTQHTIQALLNGAVAMSRILGVPPESGELP